MHAARDAVVERDRVRRAAAGEHAGRAGRVLDARRNAASRGSTWCAAGFEVVRGLGRADPPSVVPRRGTRRRSRNRSGGVAITIERLRLDRPARSTSPIPRTRAAPPLQAERHVGAERRRDAAGSPPSATQHRGRIGRSAAEPRAGGMPLCSSTATRRAARVERAPRRGSTSSAGTPAANGPSTSSDGARRGLDLERVVRLGHRHHERVELVVAVGARAEDLQRQRELRRTRRRAITPTASVSRGPVGERQRLGARASDRCRHARTRRRRPSPASASAQRLAARREPGAHEREHAGRDRSTDDRWPARRTSCTSALSTFGFGTNTVGRHACRRPSPSA